MKNNWVSLLALLISVIALIITFLRIDVTISNDTFIGIIASFIGASTTLVVGAQIYNSIETRKMKDDMQNVEENMHRKMIVIDCAINYIQGLANVTERPLSAYRDFISALDSAYDSNNHNAIEDCYNNLNAIIQKIQAGKGLNENVEQKNTQIENAIDELKKNPLYKDFEYRISPIEKQRIELFEKLKKNNDNSSNKG
ncbi:MULTISPECIES: hypothetical protein [Parabacteroides]|uniref:Uncharacterized protein n=1 Tax=Parabacteroides goldsteinii dnLKV18 TaxID=1235789 RepID=S0GU57_9BACT|nr:MULTISPECIES: hypothetical protein [Parabacteroides]EOS18568.1 hypothetical protein C803_01565 [Parabacteroides goldsteinii dnLKV18]KAI4361743.1 hypothetical protein C825_003812 [Parabacteroides sp. ASF519]MBF0763518.1 hypothetical protein [Parabacteroides goldsteinii]NBI94737.1 hypothetical protein [Parabacteroides goldsteinii]NDO65305.1 hypothetical protein [Parabacteroides goldsteinii]